MIHICTVLALNVHRGEGFARAAYFVPGCDGIGVWPNSEIVPASSASAASSVANTSKTPKSQRTK